MKIKFVHYCIYCCICSSFPSFYFSLNFALFCRELYSTIFGSHFFFSTSSLYSFPHFYFFLFCSLLGLFVFGPERLLFFFYSFFFCCFVCRLDFSVFPIFQFHHLLLFSDSSTFGLKYCGNKRKKNEKKYMIQKRQFHSFLSKPFLAFVTGPKRFTFLLFIIIYYLF